MMRLQFKIGLSMMPLVALSIFVLGAWSIKTAEKGIEQSMTRYMTRSLRSFIIESVCFHNNILKKSGLEQVDSYVRRYQQRIIEKAFKLEKIICEDYENATVFSVKPSGRIVFGSLDDEFNTFDWTKIAEKILNNPQEYHQGAIQDDHTVMHYAAYYFKPWDWIFFIAVPNREISEATAKIRNATFAIALLCLITAFFLIIFVFRKFVINPIAELREGAKTIGSGDLDFRYASKNGDELGGLSRALDTMINDLQGVTTSRDALLKEIEDRKKTEAKLIAKQMVLDESQKITHLGSWELDLVTNKLFWSEEMYRIFNLDPHDVNASYKTFLDAVHPEDRERVDKALKKSMTDKDLFNIDHKIVRPDGSIRTVHNKCIHYFDDKGNVFRSAGTVWDITDREKKEREKRELEARLQQAQKMESIGNLAGGIAHDFNNLLFPIIGFAEMLKEDLPPDSPERESAQEIFNAGHRGGELVSQILTFSRQSEHKMTPVRVQKLLKEVLKLSRSTIPSNIKIHEDIQQDCGLIMADPIQVHQVAMNLITNAYHAVESKNGAIDIELKEITIEENELPDDEPPTGKQVRFSVSDNGIGMAQSIVNKIFEPYFTTKGKDKGTGLGLAVVYGIVKEHRGEIEVYSKVGQGTTVSIYLPVMKSTAEAVSTEQTVELATGMERVLLVDDDLSVAQIVSQMLSRLGYHVTTETSSKDALNVFRSKPESFDLVVSDMTMPDMTGDQLSKEILSIKPDTPIIICTGFSEGINKERAQELGVKGFLRKPATLSDMAQMVRKVLDETKNG